MNWPRRTNVTWTIEFSKQARKDMASPPPNEQKRITQYLRTRVLAQEDPRKIGKPLKGALMGIWRYRVGELRILCRIERLIILVIAAGSLCEVYR